MLRRPKLNGIAARGVRQTTSLRNYYRQSAIMRPFVLIAFGFLAIAAAYPADTYTDKFDNVDLDEILNSDRLLRNYINCLLDKGRCTSDGKALKDHLPDALENDCKKCTEKQKKSSDKVLRFIINKKPAQWEQLKKKYDPKGIYADKYRDKLKTL